MTNHISPTVTFLTQLHVIDKAGLTVRDAMLLYFIMGSPGTNGRDAARALGFADRSSIASNINRLILHGFMEDHRKVIGKAHSNIFHATDAGRAFWETIKPQG